MRKIVSLVWCAALLLPSAVWAQSSSSRSSTSAAPPPAAAQAGDAGAEMTTATYGDWQLRCRNPGSPAAGQPPASRTCEVVQSVVVQGQTAPFAQLAFGKVPPTEGLFFTAVLPTNVTFPSTVRFQIDEADKQPVELAWTRCLPGGCFASIAPKDDVLKRWRAQNEAGRFIFKSGGGQDVTVPFSFRGLSRALDALPK